MSAYRGLYEDPYDDGDYMELMEEENMRRCGINPYAEDVEIEEIEEE